MYQPDTGQWYIGGQAQPVTFGGPGGIPASAPYQYQALGGGAIQVQSVGGSSITALDFATSAASPAAGPGAVSPTVVSAPAATTTVLPNPQVSQRVRPNTPAQTHSHPFPSLAQFVSRRARAISYSKRPG
jgi:hypothetical protein